MTSNLRDEPLLTISAICPKVMQGQNQVIKPSLQHKKKKIVLFSLNNEILN